MCLFRKHRFKKIRFFKDELGWYADIPGHTQEENEMVAGSDTLLSLLYSAFKCTNNEITLVVSDTIKRAQASLDKIKEDKEGASYAVNFGYFGRLLDIQYETCWMCDVLKDVFGKYPKHIYIHSVERSDGTREGFYTSMPFVARFYQGLLK